MEREHSRAAERSTAWISTSRARRGDGLSAAGGPHRPVRRDDRLAAAPTHLSTYPHVSPNRESHVLVRSRRQTLDM
jgi:hypothetical protein